MRVAGAASRRRIFTSTARNNPRALKPNPTIQSIPAAIACQSTLSHQQSLPRSSNPTTWRLSRVLLALGAALCVGSATTTHAQTVEPVWEPADEIEGAVAQGVAADNSGNLFVAGSMSDAAGTLHGIVQKSTDQGDTWVH